MSIKRILDADVIRGFSPPKNYIKLGSFEENTTNGWSLANTTLDSSKFPNQTSGSWTAKSGNLSFSTVASGQLAGSYSLQTVSSAASTAGDMLVSDAFTIDLEDQAKVMAFKFYYKLATGTGVFAGNNTNSYAVWIYDVTNSAWIQPAGVYNLVQSSGVGIAQGTFQTPSNGSQFRIAIVNINATSGAITMLWDDIAVGPQVTVSGPPVTDWQSYTPTVTNGGSATQQAKWRRVGDSIEISGELTWTSAGTAGIMTVSLPPGVVVDTAKLGVATQQAIGSALLILPGAATVMNTGTVTYNDTGTIAFNIQGFGTRLNGSSATSTTSTLSWLGVLPVSGYSSSTAMSSDTDTRVIACNALAQTVSGTLSTALNVVLFTNISRDDVAGYNTSTGLYTVAVAGWYEVASSVEMTGTWASLSNSSRAAIKIQRNGSITVANGIMFPPSTAAGWALAPTATGLVYCNAGDTLGVYSQCAGGATLSYTSVTSGSSLSIKRLSGPAVVAASESVNARYGTSAGQALTSTDAAITFGTKSHDSHGAFSGSTFTAPTSSKYSIKCTLALSGSQTMTTSSWFACRVYKNGSLWSTVGLIVGTGSASAYMVNGSDTVSLNAGETLQIYAACSVSTNLSTSSSNNFVAIDRVGN